MTATVRSVQNTEPDSGIFAKEGNHGGAALTELPLSAPLLKHPAVPSNKLSRRELQMALMVAQGFKNIEIADQLNISERTVKNTLHSAFRKAVVQDRLDLALWVIFHKMNPAPK